MSPASALRVCSILESLTAGEAEARAQGSASEKPFSVTFHSSQSCLGPE